MFKCLFTAITTILAGMSIAAFSSLTLAADSELAELQAMFKEADIIPDGKLDKGEFDMHHLSAFTYMDMNKDGVLDKDECAGNCFNFNNLNSSLNNQSKPYQKLEFEKTPYRFDAIDIDGSGALKVYEYILFGRERFRYFDLNKDGLIADDEFCSGYRSSMPCDISDSKFLNPQKKQEMTP